MLAGVGDVVGVGDVFLGARAIWIVRGGGGGLLEAFKISDGLDLVGAEEGGCVF